MLRAGMVADLQAREQLSPEVAKALAKVPRHLFVPGVPLEAAYAANDAVVIKRDADGSAMSSLSAAHIQAVMLEQAGIEPGMRVMEVGSGGYNAALIQELVGATGRVTTVDIDPEITRRARECLDGAGYGAVDVVLADAEGGAADSTPYDRIIVTTAVWDLPPAWVEQLAPDGRIVVPLRMRGLTRSVAFDRDNTELASRSYRLCGFVPVQGDGAHEQQVISLGEGVGLRVDDDAPDLDLAALREAASRPGTETWPGIIYDLPDELELFLMTATRHAVMLHATKARVDSGDFAASAGRGVPALIRGGSFAYRARRRTGDGRLESGVIAHGPDAAAVAEEYAALLRRWADSYRYRGAASIRYVLPAADAPQLADGLIAKRHGSVVVCWP